MRVRGVVHRKGLAEVEPDPDRRSALLRSGKIRSVGQWYVTEEAPEDLLALLELGVRPTCLDAAALHGLWVPMAVGVHAYRPRRVEAPPDAPRLAQIRRRRDAGSGELVPIPVSGAGQPAPATHPLILHAPSLRGWGSQDPVPDIVRTLDHAARCQSTVNAAILIESALNKRCLSTKDLDRLLAGLPQRKRHPLVRVRADAQSGTETAVRWWLEERRVRVRSQAQLLPDVRVDLLIGTNWVIECDSRRFHDDPAQYREDRRRDLALSSRGYRVTRLTWEQVFLEWPRTSAMLVEMLRRRDHRRLLPVRAAG